MSGKAARSRERREREAAAGLVRDVMRAGAARGSLLCEKLLFHYSRAALPDPPSEDLLVQWGFASAGELAEVADWLDGGAAPLLREDADAGTDGAGRAAEAVEAVARGMRAARERLQAHPGARVHDALVLIGVELAHTPDVAAIGEALQMHYAIEGDPDECFPARLAVLGAPPPELVAPPRIVGIELLELSQGDPDAFERAAEAVEEAVSRLFDPATDPAGLGARSAAALAAALRECREVLLANLGDPAQGPWMAVLDALADYLPDEDGEDIDEDDEPLANFGAALALYYTDGSVQPEVREAGPPPLAMIVSSAYMERELVAALRSQLAAAARREPAARDAFAALDDRLERAHDLLSDESGWGLYLPGPEPDDRRTDLCLHVTRRLSDLAAAGEAAALFDERTVLGTWLAAGYANMGASSAPRSVAPPEPSDYERLGFGPDLLLAVAEDLEQTAPSRRDRRARSGRTRGERERERDGEAAVRELAASLRRGAGRAR